MNKTPAYIDFLKLMKVSCEARYEYIMCGEICMLPWKPVLRAHVWLFYNCSSQVADWEFIKCIPLSGGKRTTHPGCAADTGCLRLRVYEI